MKLFLVSGSGYGAGKTYLAHKLCRNVWSLAGGMRDELAQMYPGYNWYNLTQEYKATTVIREWGDGRQTMRQVLLEHGQRACERNPKYWAEQLRDRVKRTEDMLALQGISVVAVDDIRKTCELDVLRSAFDCVHFHVKWEGAGVEPAIFQNDELERLADYVVTRRPS